MWKNYRMWFGQGYAGPDWIRFRQDPPFGQHKQLKPTRKIFTARNEKEARRKVFKFLTEAEITGAYGVEEINP